MKVYPVAEVFYSLQGEGAWAGTPMSFIRLAGCGVRQCHIRSQCDTAWKSRATFTARQLAEQCRHYGSHIVSITGGEPLDHDLSPLVGELRAAGMWVHLETSGHRPLRGFEVDWVTVSPKTRDYMQRSGDALKVVVLPGWTWREVELLDDGTEFSRRFLQPLTGAYGQPTNLRQVVAMVTGVRNANARWALSTQAHRLWGLP